MLIVVTDSITIYDVALGRDTHRVAIKIVVNPDTHLHIPIGDEIVFVKDAINTMIVRP